MQPRPSRSQTRKKEFRVGASSPLILDFLVLTYNHHHHNGTNHSHHDHHLEREIVKEKYSEKIDKFTSSLTDREHKTDPEGKIAKASKSFHSERILSI